MSWKRAGNTGEGVAGMTADSPAHLHPTGGASHSACASHCDHAGLAGCAGAYVASETHQDQPMLIGPSVTFSCVFFWLPSQETRSCWQWRHVWRRRVQLQFIHRTAVSCQPGSAGATMTDRQGCVSDTHITGLVIKIITILLFPCVKNAI